MLSVIIPSRDSRFLQKTIDGILDSAGGEIEVIVVLDGHWPDPMLDPNPKVIILHQGVFHDSIGMRAGINAGVSISRGEYIMKIDEHCILDKDFDLKLIQDCEDNWVVIPRRYRLDADDWSIIVDGRPPVDYMVIDYVYQRPYDKTCGMHGSEDREKFYSRKEMLIDDTMTTQGSCYFMSRKHWDKTIVRMEDEHYGPFTMEAQEICNKTWLNSGRVVVNKKTWYAHLHKGSKYGKGYGFSNEQYKKHAELNEKGRLYAIDYWLNTKDYPRDFGWLLEKFWPVKDWPENWKEQVLIDREKDYSTLNYKDDPWLAGLRK